MRRAISTHMSTLKPSGVVVSGSTNGATEAMATRKVAFAPLPVGLDGGDLSAAAASTVIVAVSKRKQRIRRGRAKFHIALFFQGAFLPFGSMRGAAPPP